MVPLEVALLPPPASGALTPADPWAHPFPRVQALAFAEANPYHALKSNCICFADFAVRVLTGGAVKCAPLVFDLMVGQVGGPLLTGGCMAFKGSWFLPKQCHSCQVGSSTSARGCEDAAQGHTGAPSLPSSCSSATVCSLC